ncbi:MAG: YciI family protein [Gammaproteobacteria bacterium]|nr:YciI family protein [Gammaproteobacteria bacterium]
MYYSIIAEDAENSAEKRRQGRVAHLQRLHVLNQQGRLLVAGPHLKAEEEDTETYCGSLIVADFDSLTAAQQWADADPYLQTGVYSQISVKPFVKVFP